MNRFAVLFCSCFILIAGYNFIQAVAAFYIFSLTVDQNSKEFKTRKEDFMAIFNGKKLALMVENQTKKIERMLV